MQFDERIPLAFEMEIGGLPTETGRLEPAALGFMAAKGWRTVSAP